MCCFKKPHFHVALMDHFSSPAPVTWLVLVPLASLCKWCCSVLHSPPPPPLANTEALVLWFVNRVFILGSSIFSPPLALRCPLIMHLATACRDPLHPLSPLLQSQIRYVLDCLSHGLPSWGCPTSHPHVDFSFPGSICPLVTHILPQDVSFSRSQRRGRNTLGAAHLNIIPVRS